MVGAMVTCGDMVAEMEVGPRMSGNGQMWKWAEWEEGVPKGRDWFCQPGVRGPLCDHGTVQRRTRFQPESQSPV